jgi:outer membrane biosynthesis protein TonB
MIKKTLLSLVIAAVLFSANLFAQNLPGDMAGAKADYLYKKLKLTNEQYASVYSIFLDVHMKMDGMKDKNMDKDQMKKTHDETMGKIEKILTKDQLTKWGVAKEQVCKVKPRKVVKKVTEEKKDDMNKEVKKDEKKDVKKDVKKDEKKDVKKDVKKDEKKDTKK